MPVSDLPPTCPHGLRPGTTVCLHCRHDARIAARRRRYLFFARLGLGTMGGAAIVALVVGGIMSMAGDGPTSEAGAAADTIVTSVAVASPPVRNTPAAAPAARAPAAPSPAIPEGRRELGDSMYAVRDGNDVTVHFDTEALRTRYDWKFEGVVRATLPLIFGDAARVALDSVPAGSFVKGGDLLSELPSRGILLKMPEEGSIRVWPVTREGRDGLLVIGYRAAGAR